MSTVKDAKYVMNAENISPIKLFFSYTLFYLHFFIWLLVIASFGVIAEF